MTSGTVKRQLQKDEEDAEASNEREHRENGMMMECQCCFDDVPINKATHCDGEEPHFFCLECAKRNANNEIGNSRYKLLCMDGSGCKAEFAKEQMRRFLEEKAMDKLERLQQQEEIRLADLDDLTSCPFCDFAAICPPVEEDREFRCANPECEKVSCRLCKLETHIPLSCEVNAKENKVNVRHAVEEAMTEALVRSCHKCKNKYIKEFGCNKMMCMRCSSIQCYVCSKDITKDGYSHFNESARGGRPGQCPLFDNTEQRHDEEVRKAEQKALDKVRAENPGFSEEELKVKVSDAVQKNERERIRQAGAAHGHYVPPRIPDIARPPLPGLQEVDIGVPIAAINERRQQLLADLARGNRERQEGVGARLEAAQAWVQAAQGRGQGGQARVQAAQVRMAQAAEARTQAAKERAQAAQARAQTAIARAQAAQAQVQLRVNTQAPAQAPANFQAQPWIQEPPQPFPGLRDPMHFGFGNDLYPPHPFGDPYNAAIPGFPLLAGGLHGQPFPAPQVFARHNQFWHGPEEGQPDGDMLNPFGNGAFGRL